MRHLNSIVKRAASLRARLDAVGRRRAAIMDNDLTDCRECADIAIVWATTIRPWVLANVGRGKAEDAWRKANMGCALRTLQAHLQIGKPENWPTYVKERRKRGDCGRYGTEFALELIAKPRPETATKRGGSATGNGKRTDYRNGPKRQDYRTPLPTFRYLDGIMGYDFDGCAGSKRVALKPAFSKDILHADVHGKRVFDNGPFGMNAQLAEYFAHCGADHVTWLTLASTNTNWFHDWVMPYARHFLFPTKRIKFRGQDNVLNSDLMLVLYNDVPAALQPHLTHTIPCSSIVLP